MEPGPTMATFMGPLHNQRLVTSPYVQGDSYPKASWPVMALPSTSVCPLLAFVSPPLMKRDLRVLSDALGTDSGRLPTRVEFWSNGFPNEAAFRRGVAVAPRELWNDIPGRSPRHGRDASANLYAPPPRATREVEVGRVQSRGGDSGTRSAPPSPRPKCRPAAVRNG